MKRLFLFCTTLIANTVAHADRFVEIDSDGGTLPPWIVPYTLAGLYVLANEKSSLHKWANLNPWSAAGIYLIFLPAIFLFKKLFSAVILILICIFLYDFFRGKKDTPELGDSVNTKNNFYGELKSDSKIKNTSNESGLFDSQVASIDAPNSDVTSSNSHSAFAKHALRVAAINFENKEKLASEFHSFLSSQIDWSSVNHYKRTGGIDPELGDIVLLICILILFQPLMIDEDSPISLQLTEVQKTKFAPSLLIEIGKICAAEIVSGSFIDLNFSDIDESETVDYEFSRDVKRASNHIFQQYSHTIAYLQQVVRNNLDQ